MKQITLQLSLRELDALLWALDWKLRAAKPDAHAGYDRDVLALAVKCAQGGKKAGLYASFDWAVSDFVLAEVSRALQEAAQVPSLSRQVQELQHQVKALTAKPKSRKKTAARSSPKATVPASNTAAPGVGRPSPTGRTPRAAPAAATAPGSAPHWPGVLPVPDALGS